jgi:hypothetical protein
MRAVIRRPDTSGWGLTGRHPVVWRVLVACGIASPVLLVAADILGTVRYAGYSFTAQSASELSAIGAPTRAFVLPLGLAGDVLLVAFGLGVWGLAGRKRAARITGAMVVGNAVVGFVASAFFPMRLGEVVSPLTTRVILGAMGVTCFLLAMVSGAAAYRTWLRFYSIGTLATFLVLGVLRFLTGPQTPAGQPVSTVGIQERAMMYGYLLWVMLLTISHLRAQRAVAPGQLGKPTGRPTLTSQSQPR